MRTKEFSRFQKNKIKHFINEFGIGVMMENKDDIQIIEPEKVRLITDKNQNFVQAISMRHLLNCHKINETLKKDKLSMKIANWLIKKESK